MMELSANARRHASYCMSCCCRPCDGAVMLTGYTIIGSNCDCCGRKSDLAMVRLNGRS